MSQFSALLTTALPSPISCCRQRSHLKPDILAKSLPERGSDLKFLGGIEAAISRRNFRGLIYSERCLSRAKSFKEPAQEGAMCSCFFRTCGKKRGSSSS